MHAYMWLYKYFPLGRDYDLNPKFFRMNHTFKHILHSENVIWSNKLFANFFNDLHNLSPLETSSSSECTLTCFYTCILHCEEIMP